MYFVVGALTGALITFVLSLKSDGFTKFYGRQSEPSRETSTNAVRRLLPEVSISDIYKSDDVISVIRDPGSVTICRRGSSGGIVNVGGFKFSRHGAELPVNEISTISDCFRSVNAFEVWLGYPCIFNPGYTIRFKSKSGAEFVDFLVGKDCALVDWYFNSKSIDGSITRLMLSSLGKLVIEDACNKYILTPRQQNLCEEGGSGNLPSV